MRLRRRSETRGVTEGSPVRDERIRRRERHRCGLADNTRQGSGLEVNKGNYVIRDVGGVKLGARALLGDSGTWMM